MIKEPKLHKPLEKEPEKRPEIDPTLDDKSGIEIWEGEGGTVYPEKPKKKRKEKITLEKLATQKRDRLEALRLAIKKLDEGGLVKEFEDRTRKVIYFDEENQQYFLEERGQRKNVGMGDIVSDYAWGIKYVPDYEIIGPAYRTLAKRILTNETRRDIESIYDRELVKTYIEGGIMLGGKQSLHSVERGWKKWRYSPQGKGVMFLGFIAEIAVRELLNRVALNNKLDFTVLRTSIVEDSIYKYDFKIRVHQGNRGVKIKQEGIKYGKKKNEIGIQFGLIRPKYSKKKAEVIKNVKEKFRDRLPVRDILLITMQTEEFAHAFNKWLELGEPSGGPEQFLSPELKKAILKAVTEKLVDIPQGVFDKIT